MFVPVNSLLIKDLGVFKGTLTPVFTPFGAQGKSSISPFCPLRGSQLKKKVNKPCNSGSHIILKINGGTAIFNGVQALSFRNLFHFLFTNKKTAKWLRILSF
jgi:hypothetical protein